MYEQVCLSCGKHLPVDDRPYCSDQCESGDFLSPTLSSTSSAFSSPFLGFQDATSDIPTLVLNSSFKSDHYASSASSTCWSATDDEDCDSVGYTSDFRYPDEGIIEPQSKPIRFMPNPQRPSAMSYARRPSGLNNPGKSRNVFERSISSGSSSEHGHGAPMSAPIQSHLHHTSTSSEDDGFSDGSRDDLDFSVQEETRLTVKVKKQSSTTSKARRSQNRASLPAYFSMLQLSTNSPQSVKSNSNSSSNTIARLSPPTPKVDFSTAQGETTPSSLFSNTYTPRGRRKLIDRSERVESDSSSRERSGSHTATSRRSATSGRRSNHNSVEQVFDWPSTVNLDPRERSLRRSSSPSSKKLEGGRVFMHDLGFPRRKVDDSLPGAERRGRFRADELQGPTFCDAPGLGYGRSGLVGRRTVR